MTAGGDEERILDQAEIDALLSDAAEGSGGGLQRIVSAGLVA